VDKQQPDNPNGKAAKSEGKVTPKTRALLVERELLLALKENVQRTKDSYQRLGSFYRKEGDFGKGSVLDFVYSDSASLR